MRVTYDPPKREWTLKERGLDFQDAGKVFDGRTLTKPAPQGFGEDRYVTLGRLDGRAVVLVWTPRDGSRRIISMRYAHEREVARWHR